MSLYRKFRPNDFNSVIGQNNIIDILRSSIIEERISHAYLFTGTRGVGKTTTARIFAKSINCNSLKNGNPCNKCESCKSFIKGTNVDLIEIDAASNRGIDDIREIKEKVSFAPTMSKYKVYIIDEVHMLTRDAFNALLKTLEEPPLKVVFILATTEIYKVPLTIISRCQRFDFRSGNNDSLSSLLRIVCDKEGVKIDKNSIELISDLAEGSYRDSLTLLEKLIANKTNLKVSKILEILGIPEKQIIINLIKYIKTGDKLNAINEFKKSIEGGIDSYHFNKAILKYLEEVLISLSNKSNSEVININLSETIDFIKEFLDNETRLKFTSVPSIIIETSIISLCDKYDFIDNKKNNINLNEIKLNINDVKIKTKIDENENIDKVKIKINEVISVDDKVIVNTSHSTSLNLTIDEIKKNWGKIILRLMEFNHHLSSFLSQSVPIAIDGDKLLLQVRYDFHKDRIEAVKSKEAIKKIFQDEFQISLIPICEVNASLKIDRRKMSEFEKKQQMEDNIKNVEPIDNIPTDVIDEALKIFSVD